MKQRNNLTWRFLVSVFVAKARGGDVLLQLNYAVNFNGFL